MSIINLGKIICTLVHGEREYHVNGVVYSVEARYDPPCDRSTMLDKFKKSISSAFIQLPGGGSDDIIASEYVCSDCDVSADAGKENLIHAAE